MKSFRIFASGLTLALLATLSVPASADRTTPDISILLAERDASVREIRRERREDRRERSEERRDKREHDDDGYGTGYERRHEKARDGERRRDR